FTRPMAVLLLILDHLVVSGWILLFATPSSSVPYLLFALVAAEAVFRFDLWGGIGTSLFFTSGIILFQTSDLGLAISVRDSILRARSEEHTSELQSRENLVCRLLLEKKKK